MASPTRTPEAPQAPPPIRLGGRSARFAPPPPLWRRARRVLLVATLILLVPVGASYVSTMFQSSDTRFGVRSVEWLRDHGASKLVSWVEDTYYSLNAPSKGGPALKQLPSLAGAALPFQHLRFRHTYYLPPRIRPVIDPALPGEGVWHRTFGDSHGAPPVLVTTFRNEADYPRIVTGVAWIRASTTHVQYIPGVAEPPVPVPRGSTAGEIPPSARYNVLAAFNGGFKLNDAAEGFATHGHTWRPMVNGIGTLVGYADGKTDVIDWTSGANVPTNIVFARQNLPLIINHGRLNPNLSDGPEWGATVGNAIRVWRSGVGVDRHGNLLYVAADNQTVRSLATALLRAGAVRALELDINHDWITFITYKHHNAGDPSQLLPDIYRPANRYLTPDDRDFFAIFAR